MNATEKKALLELSKSLSEVREFASTIKDIADNLTSIGGQADNVQDILKDNDCDIILKWLTSSVKDVQMLMRILK